MRKVVAAFLMITGIAFSAFSQQAIVSAELEQAYRASYQLFMDAYKQKDYVAAETELIKFRNKFIGMPASIQRNYPGVMANQYYCLSCVNALNGNKNKAILYLDSAARNGYSNYKNMLTDTDLNGLREEKRFKIVLQQIREKGDYGYILQKSGAYNLKDKRVAVKFTYQDLNAPELVKFRKQYKLDSVGGNGDEISRFKNLLLWVHHVVRHDGNSGNPIHKNAIDLIDICKKEDRGVNCRMMATVLRDTYQAMGFKSRTVTCMPKDTADFDCHVITVVWSETKNKWLWMDPTFNAYVSDAKGTLLNVEEVRAKLIKGEPLVLNEDANWNNKTKKTKEDYLDYYMSKNLYWINCDVKNEWDVETRGIGKPLLEVVHLYPGGFTRIKGNKVINKSDITYATNNVADFWAKPGN